MHDQQSLFNGYLRIEILNNLSTSFNKIIATDVINLCSKFYTLNIKSLKESHHEKLVNDTSKIYPFFHNPENEEKWIYRDLAFTLSGSREYFIGYKILKMLISSNDKAEIQSIHYNVLGLLLRERSRRITIY